MTEDRLRTYVIECSEHIRDGEDLDDEEFLAVCRAIGSMPDEALLAVIELGTDLEPEQIAARLRAGRPDHHGAEDLDGYRD